jgi:hypothetical protein
MITLELKAKGSDDTEMAMQELMSEISYTFELSDNEYQSNVISSEIVELELKSETII